MRMCTDIQMRASQEDCRQNLLQYYRDMGSVQHVTLSCRRAVLVDLTFGAHVFGNGALL